MSLEFCTGNPSVLSTFNFSSDTGGSYIPFTVCCKYAYVIMDSPSYTLYTIDLSDGANPSIVNTLNLGWSSAFRAYMLVPYDNDLYVFGYNSSGTYSSNEFACHSIDITNRAAPLDNSSWSVANNAGYGFFFIDAKFFEQGGKIYVAASHALKNTPTFEQRIYLIEVTPTAGTLKSQITASCASGATYLSYKNSRLYFNYNSSNTNKKNLDVVDISNVTSPSLTQHSNFFSDATFLSHIAGYTLWVFDNFSGDLIGIDISTLDSPAAISTFTTSQPGYGTNIENCYNVLYIFNFPSSDVTVDAININDPSSPSLISTTTIGSNISTLGGTIVNCGRIYVDHFRLSDYAPEIVIASS